MLYLFGLLFLFFCFFSFVFFFFFFFFFQAEDGIRDVAVTGVQTCALPISAMLSMFLLGVSVGGFVLVGLVSLLFATVFIPMQGIGLVVLIVYRYEIGRASCRERV